MKRFYMLLEITTEDDKSTPRQVQLAVERAVTLDIDDGIDPTPIGGISILTENVIESPKRPELFGCL